MMKFKKKTNKDLVNDLVAQVIEVDSSTISVSSNFARCASYFYDGHLLGALNTKPLVPEKCIILSTGSPESFNEQDSDITTSSFCSSCTDPDLKTLMNGSLYDVCWIQFKFRCIRGAYEPLVRFNYVFGSDEYLEFVDDVFNDVFGLFLNGENIAKLPNNDIVSINTVNHKRNSDFFHSNAPAGAKVYPRIEADGFTSMLQASGTPNIEWNTIKLAIADVQDKLYDSWVLLERGSFTCTPKVRKFSVLQQSNLPISDFKLFCS